MKFKSLFTLLLAMVSTVAIAEVKYVFYYIGDGMGVGTVSLAQAYNRMVRGSEQPLTMMQFPVSSLAFTHSASSPVTDSAAAGTALATGSKTKNGMLGMNADTVAVESIAKKLHDQGYGVGLVTSVAPDDATPAAFYAHQPYRGMYYEIGLDAAASGFEFLGGATLRGRNKDKQPTDLLEVLAQNGVAVVKGVDQLKETSSRRVILLGTNTPNDNEIGLAIDSIEGALTLAQLTQSCLDHLLANTPDKFFMMVEGGSIDHAGHANDAATSVMETINFDNALKIAYNFYLQHPDETLIVVTADHETGGLALANKRLHYNIEPKYLQYPRMSKDLFSDYCKDLFKKHTPLTWPQMKEYITDKLGLYKNIPVSESEDKELEEMYVKTFEKRQEKDVKGLYNSFNAFAEKVYQLISSVSGVGWTTNDHSGAPVPVFAVGVDANKFSQIQDNTEIPQKIYSITQNK